MEDNLSRIFNEFSKGGSEMDAKELTQAVGAVFHTGM